MQNKPSPDAPSDMGIGTGGNDNSIKKGDDGFETWTGK